MPGDGDGHAWNWLSHYEARTPSKYELELWKLVHINLDII